MKRDWITSGPYALKQGVLVAVALPGLFLRLVNIDGEYSEVEVIIHPDIQGRLEDAGILPKV